MYKETALSRARAALQHNPLLLLMCALSVLIHKTAASTAAPISGGFVYRCGMVKCSFLLSHTNSLSDKLKSLT